MKKIKIIFLLCFGFMTKMAMSQDTIRSITEDEISFEINDQLK